MQIVDSVTNIAIAIHGGASQSRPDYRSFRAQ
jgi:hypothetical protein